METLIFFILSCFVVLARVLSEKYVTCLFRATVTNAYMHCQVRVVQHKQTRDLFALKYINKTKCVKMKAVANVIQERRLLEEVRVHSYLRTRSGLKPNPG